MAGKWKSFAQHHRLFRLPGRLGDPRRRPDQRRVASIAEHARHGRRPTHVAHVVAEDTGLTMIIPMQNEFKKAYPAAAERFPSGDSSSEPNRTTLPIIKPAPPEHHMRIVAFITVVLVILAAALQLYYLQHDQLAALLKLFLPQPLPQQAAWVMILTAPVLLFFAGLWGYGRMQQRWQSRALATQITNLQTAQKNNEDAAKYLDRIDPEQDVSDLRRRLSETEHLIDHHDGRNQSADLAAGIEQVREQQEALEKTRRRHCETNLYRRHG
jgi:hypothetical protein